MDIEELEALASRFKYKNLLNRYKVLEEIFDIKEGDTVIDGGSYKGDMALYFSKKVGTDGRVYAFEPIFDNFKVLINFCINNNLTNVIPYQLALSDENKKVQFYMSEYTNAGSILPEFRKVNPDDFLFTRTASVDTLIKKHKMESKIDYVWTNIEGAELKAIKGMKQMLKDNDCQLCISTHRISDTYTNTEDVEKLLQSYGYGTERIKGHEFWIYARK